MTPCVVITRDRASYARRTLEALHGFAGDLDIHIVDHGSTYGPMLDLLAEVPYPVHRRATHPPRDIWAWEGLREIVGDCCYLVTDPDLVFDGDCPRDWLDRLHEVLHRRDSYVIKVGMGLRLDDLPPTPLTSKVTAMEKAYWVSPYPAGIAWHAPVDTTMALHRPLAEVPHFGLAPAARLNAPYLMRHLPWYGDLSPEETAYYRRHHVRGASYWIDHL